MLNEKQTNLVNKIAKENGFENFTILVEAGSKKGDNYLGNIYLITIKEKDASNNTSSITLKEKTLILKSSLKNEQVRAQMPIDACYRREIFLYDTVLPAFKKLQEEYPLPHPFKAFAQIYGYSEQDGDEWLLFENIKSRGFKMLDRKLTMNFQQISIVVKELAKLHFLSFVMKHVQPEQYDKLTANLQDVFLEKKSIQEHFIQKTKRHLNSATKIVEGNEKAKEALRRCEETIEETLKDFADEKNGLVVLHGDSWCNNMMFKFEDSIDTTEKPTELCLLDWQLSKVSIPIMDLSYFLILSASKEILDDHKKYLQQYYQVLGENLKAVGGNIQSVFPYEVFESQCKRFFKIGLFITIANIELLLRDEKDAKTLTDMAEEGKKLFKTSDISYSEQGRERLKNIILMLVKNDYL